MNRIKIEVTQEDIDNGKPANALYCPVARAISRKIDSEDIRVYSTHVNVGAIDSFAIKQYMLPQSAKRWITRFDDRVFGIVKNVKPFNFYLTEYEYRPR